VTSNSASLPILLVVLGCGPTSSPTENRASSSKEGLGEIAERLLRSDAPFDLSFPTHAPPKRETATNALVTACRNEHHPSCWLLLQVAMDESALRVGLVDVISQCQRGDLWSCQAIPPLPPHPLLPQGLPGERGRFLFRKGVPTDDDARQLRDECRDGFPHSCQVLAEFSPDLAERREMGVKAAHAARAGCRRKVPDACALVDSTWPEPERLAALDWNCQIRRHQCDRLGAALLALGRRDEARLEYERSCQYGRHPQSCLDLAALYREGKLTEPVRDRATAIQQFACSSLEDYQDPADYPECASSR
jgi:hypothetical protein